MRGTRVTRLGSRGVLVVPGVLLLIPLLVAGCGSGGRATTTTTTTTTTTVSTSASTGVVTTSSATTASTGPTTTATTGIVITLPTTSSTESTTTTTTEKLSSAETLMANGHVKAMGYIDKVYVKDGKRYISIDYAQMLTGDAATTAAIAEGFIDPGESLDTDYYISNVNPQKRVFEVSDTVKITTSTRWVPGEDMGAPCTWAAFKSFWGMGPFPESEGHLHAMPWWIERDGPLVVKIDEQYLP
jgi:hypothetical protein